MSHTLPTTSAAGLPGIDSTDDNHRASSAQTSAQPSRWSYEEAFCRNRGLITHEEQQLLRNCRVAIAGLGGIGGIDLVTLARLGIGQFTIADPDVFEPANTNRQVGAMSSTMGQAKATVMAAIVRDINPEAEVRVFSEAIGPKNADEFLDGADLFIDAIEFFDIDGRRLLFRMAADMGIYGIAAGPVGFSAIWIVFDPRGMTFDRYFDLRDDMDQLEKLVAFGVGVAPRATQTSYMDLRSFDPGRRTGPSSSIACHIAAGAVGCEAVKVLLGKGRVRTAPYYQQFDPFVGRFVCGKLRGGNRHPWQRIRRWWFTRYLRNRCEAERAA